MDGCSQMVFCTHLSYTDDKEKEGSKQEKWKKKTKNKPNKKPASFYRLQSWYRTRTDTV